MLEEMLIKEKHGIQLESYEVLPCDPLHDVKKQRICISELPLHLKKEEKGSWRRLELLFLRVKKPKEELTTRKV